MPRYDWPCLVMSMDMHIQHEPAPPPTNTLRLWFLNKQKRKSNQEEKTIRAVSCLSIAEGWIANNEDKNSSVLQSTAKLKDNTALCPAQHGMNGPTHPSLDPPTTTVMGG